MGSVYTIPAGCDAIAEYARWHHAQQHHTALVLVPNRRIARGLAEALQKSASTNSCLLPMIMPMGQLERTQLLQIMAHIPSATQEILALPHTMPEGQILHHLTRQVMAYQQAREGRGNLLHALALAKQLSQLLAECDRHAVQFTAAMLYKLAPPSFAQHWQDSAEFLSVLAQFWPDILAEHHAITPEAEQRALSDILQRYLPQFSTPVIAFGSTGSVPYIRSLLVAIAAHPHGSVMLPGMDMQMPQAQWDALAASHAQYGVKTTLHAMQLSRESVIALSPQPAQAIFTECFAASNTPITSTPMLNGFVAQHPQEEARLITLLLREALETPDKTALLITPDIALMRRVAAMMGRYGILPDSPPLQHRGESSAGSLIQRCLALLQSPHELWSLRGLLEHEALFVNDRVLYETWLHENDAIAFRGKTQWRRRTDDGSRVAEAVHALLEHAEAISDKQLPLSAWLSGLLHMMEGLQIAESIRTTLHEWCELLGEAAALYPPLAAMEFAALWQEFLRAPAASTVPSHPRIRMLTPVEARLMHADTVILGAFHAASWGAHTSNGWLNQAQLHTLGLPTHSQAQSLTAHDVWMHLHAPQVIITFAKTDNGQPTTPHALWHRLQPCMQFPAHYAQWLRAMRATEFCTEPAVAPQPDAAMRPNALRVTQLDALFQNPYAIYAEKILQLAPLDPYGPPSYPALFGIMAHALIAQCWEHGAFSDAALQAMLEREAIPADMQHFWNARLRAVREFALHEVALAQTHAWHGAPEVTLEESLPLPCGTAFALKGRIDAVITQNNQLLSLTDYKTGNTPSKKDVEAGRASQLTAYGIMLQQSKKAWPHAIRYLRLPDAKNDEKPLELTWDAATWEAHREGLLMALQTMLKAETPFLAHPLDTDADTTRYSDYDGVCRIEEWG